MSAYDQVKIKTGVVSGVINATESNVSISSDSAYDSVAYVPLMS